MQCDIALAVEQIQAPEQLKATVVRLFREHAEGSEGARKAALEEDAAEASASSLAKRWEQGWAVWGTAACSCECAGAAERLCFACSAPCALCPAASTRWA